MPAGIDKALISLSASSSKERRDEVSEVATRAGFDIIEVVSEPIPAAINAGIVQVESKSNVLVIDCGHSALKLAILNVDSYSA